MPEAIMERDARIAAAVKDTRSQTKQQAAEPIVIRRFELPDFGEHNAWLIERLSKIYPKVTLQSLNSRLQSILYNNEFLFLYQKNAVAVAQIVRGNSIEPTPAVHEWFVFVREPDNAEQVAQAAAFYADFLRWAKSIGAEAIILSELSDVKPEQAKPYLGNRLFEKQQVFARVA